MNLKILFCTLSLIIGFSIGTTMDKFLIPKKIDVQYIKEVKSVQVANLAHSDIQKKENANLVIHDKDNKLINNNNQKAVEETSVLKKTLQIPENGIYFGAFANFGPHEDNVTRENILEFQQKINKKIAWAYFSDNWFEGIEFPNKQVELLKEMNITPYIRIMPRTDFDKQGKNSPYTLENIAEGEFDEELKKWAQSAKNTNIPIILEFGTEVNGDWFPWNAKWNSSKKYKAGNLLFIETYRHIINIFREEEALNITWVYHVNSESSPNINNNGLMDYYPGDDYIDWIGVSVYGAQSITDYWQNFNDSYSNAYTEITNETEKPIAIVEFGVSENYTETGKSKWLDEVFTSIKNKYPKTKGLAYWHSSWIDDNGAEYNLRIDSTENSLETFKKNVADDYFISNTIFNE